MPNKGTINKVPRICLTCRETFWRFPSQAIGRKYCSNKCRAAYGRAPIVVDDVMGTASIPLQSHDGSIRAYAIIDAADAEWAGQWWWGITAGYAARRGVDGDRTRIIYLHRQLLGLVHGDGLEGDHIDRNRMNCRRGNLRAIRTQGNRQNVPGFPRTSLYRGVSWSKDSHKWIVQVHTNGRNYRVGYFDDEEEAAQVALEARLRLLPYAVD